MKFRKAALKARHKAHLEQERQQIEKEIEQSVNELKLQLEVNRLKAVEKQVNLYFFRVGTPAKFLKFILHPQTRNLISSFSISNTLRFKPQWNWVSFLFNIPEHPIYLGISKVWENPRSRTRFCTSSFIPNKVSPLFIEHIFIDEWY